MRVFKDKQYSLPVFEDDLQGEFSNLQEEQPDRFDCSFEDYIKQRISKSGDLVECDESQVKGMIFGYAVGGMLQMAKEITRRWHEEI